jgi:hypothetical protein
LFSENPAGMTIAHRPSGRKLGCFTKGWMNSMLWTILLVLLVLWLLGLIGGVGGNLIHLLLVVAVIVLILQLVTGRRTVV